MPEFRITARETWELLVDYEIAADSEEEAKEEIETGKLSYADFEHLDREVKKVIDITIVDYGQHRLSGFTLYR
ncbi:MAG: hypothetical protein LC778_00810 [Acidobacteria bacterium]|nr:hypothetical protein [Acidobacteriota bacterium]